jgi:hypothetical protein
MRFFVSVKKREKQMMSMPPQKKKPSYGHENIVEKKFQSHEWLTFSEIIEASAAINKRKNANNNEQH